MSPLPALLLALAAADPPRSLATVVFGEAQEPGEPAEASPDIQALYQRLFPGREAVGEAVAVPSETKKPEQARESFTLGWLSFRPSVSFSYVDAENTFLDAQQPVRARYFQIEPSFGTQLSIPSVRLGYLKLGYVPRIRKFSSIEALRRITHELTASLELPVTGALTIEAAHRYVRGTLETTEVDPGQEYFSQLGRFTRRQTEAGVRIAPGGRFDLELGGTLNKIRFDEESGFFGYESRAARAGLGYELTPDVRLGLRYVFDQVPAPSSRPLVESRSHSYLVTLTGDVAALSKGEISFGYRAQESPRAGEGGRQFRGFVVAAQVAKELRGASRLTLSANRATALSAFEDNAFYVTTAVHAGLTVPLPLSFSLSGGAGYHWNRYRTIASDLGEPREDRIFGWSVGLGRSVSRWAYLRADYRRDRRDSNLGGLNNKTDALIVQLGVGLFGAPAHR